MNSELLIILPLEIKTGFNDIGIVSTI